ncbi:cache domain-containing protein [Algoriphagus aestuarii]|nr:cache domain-containing protein [Algoriphagus aestuarii]
MHSWKIFNFPTCASPMVRNNWYLFLIICSFFSCNRELTKEDLPETEHLTLMVKEMEEEILVLEKEIIWLESFYQGLLENKDYLLNHADRNKYIFEGAFSNNIPVEGDGLSKLILSSISPDPKKSLDEIYFTNGLDSAFKAVYDRHDIIAQVYSNSTMQVSRVYPPYDAQNLMDPDINLKKYNFYYEADLEHNPAKKSVWIPEVYVDPAGKGWIMSLVHPVYEGAELFAVLGIDITVDEILHRFLDVKEGNYLIVNEKGDIVSGKSSAIEALSLPPLKNHIYRETIQADNFRISDFNLFMSKSKGVREMAQAFIFNKENKFVFEDEYNLTSAIAYPFNFTDWYLIQINPPLNGE